MSGSRRKEPVAGVTAAASEKQWKREANRKLRKAAAQVLQQLPSSDPDGVILPVLKDVANLYDSPKEGKYRFDPREDPRRMRK